MIRAAIANGVCLFLVVTAPPAGATIIADDADDICLPTEDPCIIDDKVEVLPPGDLDFGTRTVRITGSGKLLGTNTVTCGDFVVDLGGSKTAVDTTEPNNVAGSFTLNSSGTVDIDGQIKATGNPGGLVRIYADGDITLDGKILAEGVPIGSPGGEIEIESYNGSVTTNATLKNKATKGNDYDTDEGGDTFIRAYLDVTVNGFLDSSGGASGGAVFLGGRDVSLHNGIDCSAGAGISYGQGGGIFLCADRNLTVTGAGSTQTQPSRLANRGSIGYYFYGPYTYSYVGPGGYTYLEAEDGDVYVSRHVSLFNNSGKGSYYGNPSGGVVYLRTYEGEIYFGGTVEALGYSRGGSGGFVFIESETGFDLGPGGVLDTKSKYGGGVSIVTDYYGESRIEGKIDVRGRLKQGSGEYAYEGEGGYFDMFGDTDIYLSGKILGGAEDPSRIEISSCRLHLTNSAVIDNAHGAPVSGGDIEIEVDERMYAGPGSRITADAQGGGEVFIDYRYGKPPELLGQIVPPPALSGGPSSGCPICGNSELDAGESCDDGNVVGGDGCDENCDAELCIAQTPGWPGVPLCDDGDDCTLDQCDPDTGCSNPVSCEEGVSCTVDACVTGACQHTPDDSACNDFNDCTDDLCNATTGCVYANLTGPSCEDGDLCTLTGDCDSGACIATDEVHADESTLKIRFGPGVDDDRMNFRTLLPLSDFTTNPTDTGLMLEIRDSDNQTAYTAEIPASAWEDKSGAGLKFRFKDSDSEVPSANGIRSMKITRKPSTGVAKVRMKSRDSDAPGVEGQFRISVSLLFGSNPSTDDCLTARFVPCEPEAGENTCES